MTELVETLARKNGACRLCPDPIEAGEHYITHLQPVGWVHVKCARGYKRVLDEHDLERPEESKTGGPE